MKNLAELLPKLDKEELDYLYKFTQHYHGKYLSWGEFMFYKRAPILQRLAHFGTWFKGIPFYTSYPFYISHYNEQILVKLGYWCK